MNILVRLFYGVYMRFWERIKQGCYEYLSSRGYTCDVCGREIFDYPSNRLCDDCFASLSKNDGKVCEKCGRQTLSSGICLTCKRELPKFRQGFSPLVYRAESASIVNRMKNGNPRLALWLGEAVAEYFLANYADIERFKEGGETLLLIPVPLTKSKKKKRGYNQAEELAKSICKRLQEYGVQVELRTDVLERLRDGEEQKHMGFADRHTAVAAVYHVHKRKECRDRTVLLIDDIMTTGATGSVCAERLYGANAKEVLFLTPTALPEQK